MAGAFLGGSGEKIFVPQVPFHATAYALLPPATLEKAKQT